MAERPHRRWISRQAKKKTATTFSPVCDRNTLDNAISKNHNQFPHASSRQKRENALELARALCLFANAGRLSGGAARVEAQRLAEDLLRRAGWREGSSFDDFARLEPLSAAMIAESSLKSTIKVFVMGERRVPVTQSGLALASQCCALAERLDALIAGAASGEAFSVDRRELFVARIRENGSVEHTRVAPLGPYQNVFERVLEHPRIDVRRFAHCTKCDAFYYKPRRSSKACGRRCENALRAQEHYYREKQNRNRALEMRFKGKSVFEIACELGIERKRVRRYLNSK